MGVKNEILALEVGDIEGFNEEVNDYCNTLSTSIIPSALRFVASEMTVLLKNHIQKDVYDVYETLDYPRRGEQNIMNFGEGLASDSYIHIDLSSNMKLGFLYEPKGYHSGRMQDTKRAYENKDDSSRSVRSSKWLSRNWDRPIKPNPVHGDELIKRIQSGEGYDWNVSSDIVTNGRPFWDNFVAELRYGKLANSFVAGFKDADLLQEFPDIHLDPADVEWGGEEGYLNGSVIGSDDMIDY